MGTELSKLHCIWNNFGIAFHNGSSSFHVQLFLFIILPPSLIYESFHNLFYFHKGNLPKMPGRGLFILTPKCMDMWSYLICKRHAGGVKWSSIIGVCPFLGHGGRHVTTVRSTRSKKSSFTNVITSFTAFTY